MSIQRGDASAFMTKLVSDTASYVTLMAAMTVIVVMIDKKGYPGIGVPMAVLLVVCSVALGLYWVGHVIEQAHAFFLENKSFLAGVHVALITLVTILSGTAALVIALVTLKG